MGPQSRDGAGLTTPAWAGGAVKKLTHSYKLDAVAERLAPVADPLGSGRAGEVLRGKWLGHALHPALTDLPLGCWLSASVLDLTGGRSSRRAARRLIGWGLVFTVPTAASGLADWSHARDHDERVRRVGVVHAVGNTVVAMLYFRSWRARRRDHHLRGVALSSLAGALALGPGWLGRHMAIAYGAGTGERGFAGEDGSGHGSADGRLMDVEQASQALGVPVEQVEVMVADGLLVPVDAGGAPHFRPADVEAVRHLGG